LTSLCVAVLNDVAAILDLRAPGVVRALSEMETLLSSLKTSRGKNGRHKLLFFASFANSLPESHFVAISLKVQECSAEHARELQRWDEQMSAEQKQKKSKAPSIVALN
jgi:hypothetical protein